MAEPAKTQQRRRTPKVLAHELPVSERLCVYCNQPGTEASPLSRRRKHAECANAAVELAIEQVHAKDGPMYDRWRQGMLAAAFR